MLKLQKRDFKNNVSLFFLQFKNVIFWIRGQKYFNYAYFHGFKWKTVLNFCKDFKGVFSYFSHHGRSAFFSALLLLLIQYLNLTIRCVSCEYLMSVMKYFSMSICLTYMPKSKCKLRPTAWSVQSCNNFDIVFFKKYLKLRT